jgi:hypothetical protein
MWILAMLVPLLVALPVSGQEVTASNGNSVSNANYSLDYTVGEIAIQTVSAGSSILTQGFHQPLSDTLALPVSVHLQFKAFLQGAYQGNALMHTSLNQGGYLPLQQPYNTAPWFYGGTESLVQVPAGMVDWVLVELRSAPNTIVARKAALLFDNGMLYDTNLTAGLTFDNLPPDPYHIVIDHRNHSAVMTYYPLYLSSGNLIDFSDTTATPLYGGSIASIALGGGLSGLITGDINKDGLLKYSGPDNDRARIQQRIISESGSLSILSSVQGYFNEDLTMDGTLKYSGSGNDRTPIIQNLITLTGSNSITIVLQTAVPQGL